MSTTPAPAGPAWRRLLGRYWGLLIVLAVVLLVAGVRFRFRDVPLERDEGEYAYAGQLLLQGVPPYQLAYNMKFPGTYAVYAVIMAVFGQTSAGIHVGILCLTSLTALMLYWLGRRLCDEWAGAAAGLSGALLSASPSMLGLAGHATQFAAFFATAGLCGLYLTWESKRVLPALAAGILFGITLLMKQQAAVICLWGLVMLAFVGLRQPQLPWAKRWQIPAAASLGAALPVILTGLILWRAGVFDKFWFWTVRYAQAYVSLVAPADRWKNLTENLRSVWLFFPSIWLAAAIGVVVVCLPARLRTARLLLPGFLLASFLSTCPGYFFRTHYFLLMVPAVGLLAGCAISLLQYIPLRPKPLWPALGCSLLLAHGLWTTWGYWFQLTPDRYAHTIYGPNPFPEARSVAEFIRTNSLPNDQIAVLGSEPQIYFYSQRHSATGYIYTYALLELQPFAHEMHEEMIREIETARPKFVVFALVNQSWIPRDNSELSVIQWWFGAYQANYTMVGRIDLLSPTDIRSTWGPDTATQADPSMTALLVYQRNQPVESHAAPEMAVPPQQP